jgi:hypothetical protein
VNVAGLETRPCWSGQCPACERDLQLVTIVGVEREPVPPHVDCPYCGHGVCTLHDGVFAELLEQLATAALASRSRQARRSSRPAGGRGSRSRALARGLDG